MEVCLSRSTAHGLLNIGNEPKICWKIIWLVLTIATLSCFIYHTHTLYNQLVQEQVLVATKLNAVPFIQPDIIFCPEQFFAKDFIINPPANEYNYMLNVSKKIQEFSAIYSNTNLNSNLAIWDTLNLNELYKAFFQRKHEFFLSIACNQREIDFNNITVEMNFAHFACFRMKSNSCILTSPLDNIIVKMYTHNYGVNLSYSKLNVMIKNKTIDSYLFVQKEKIDEMEDGIQIYFVQPNNSINADTIKIKANLNTHTTIKIKSTEYTRASTKKSSCDKFITYNEIYNLLEEDLRKNIIQFDDDSLCMEIFYQKAIYKKFHCVTKQFPIPKELMSDFSFCGDISKSVNYERLSCLNYLDTPALHDNITSHCEIRRNCKSIKYSTTVNYNYWPSTSILEHLFKYEIQDKLKDLKDRGLYSPGLLEALNDVKQNPSNINSWKDNFIKVTISPGEFRSTVITESFTYTSKNFFSDIGGIMGFYMGASLLTVCELLRLLNCTIKSMKSRKKSDQVNEENIVLKDQIIEEQNI